MTRYVAFISYSHRDRAETEWLHNALERYRIPSKLVGTETRKGPVPKRLIPIFRDRDELGAADDLGEQLRDALANSGHLIVIASPAASASMWVNEEILSYKRLHGEGRVLALIVGGEPWASNLPGREAEEAFPAALRFRLGPDGALSDQLAEPIAADIRPNGDGKRLGLMKLIAGLTGLRLDDLVQREAQRRARRLTIVASGLGIGMVGTSSLAFYANEQRKVAVEQRQIAEKETAAARAATDYLIGTFELTNPATENPRTVSLVTILGRSAERARIELKEQPEIEARLVTAVGRAYNNLGLLDEAEIALARALPAINRAGPDGAAALVALAETHLKKGELAQGVKRLDDADRLLGADTRINPAVRARVAAARGSIAYVNADQDQALAAYDRALAYLAADSGADPRERAMLLDGRGRILNDLGRFDEAEASLREANALFVRYRGPKHLTTGRNLYALALVAYTAGKYDLAQSLVQQSLDILSKMLDQTNPIWADALSLRGQIYRGQGQLVAADRALEQSIEAYRQVYKGPHYNIGIADFYRAQVALDLGNLADALKHLDSAQRNYEASYGKVHANIGELMVSRATILARSGRIDEARAQCDSGIAMLNETVGADNSFVKAMQKDCDRLRT
jgi:tetratricopeptide (TPR) repeat protein